MWEGEGEAFVAQVDQDHEATALVASEEVLDLENWEVPLVPLLPS